MELFSRIQVSGVIEDNEKLDFALQDNGQLYGPVTCLENQVICFIFS